MKVYIPCSIHNETHVVYEMLQGKLKSPSISVMEITISKKELKKLKR
jgi:hypothetical protein